MSNIKSQTPSNAPETIHGGTGETRYLEITGKGVGFTDYTGDPKVQRWGNSSEEFITLAECDLSFLYSIERYVKEKYPAASLRISKGKARVTMDRAKSKTEGGGIVS